MGGFGFPEMFHEKPQTCVSLVEKLINWSLFKKLRTLNYAKNLPESVQMLFLIISKLEPN